MAWLDFCVGDKHVTLVHIEGMTEEMALVVDHVCTEFVKDIKRGPTGIYGERLMVGRFKNVKAIRVNSPYLLKFQAKLKEELESFDVPVSDTFGPFMPHISRPTDDMATGLDVPFSPWLDFHWKEHGVITYEMAT